MTSLYCYIFILFIFLILDYIIYSNILLKHEWYKDSESLSDNDASSIIKVRQEPIEKNVYNNDKLKQIHDQVIL